MRLRGACDIDMADVQTAPTQMGIFTEGGVLWDRSCNVEEGFPWVRLLEGARAGRIRGAEACEGQSGPCATEELIQTTENIPHFTLLQ